MMILIYIKDTLEIILCYFELFKGDELGRFNMGSTVIILLPETAPALKLQSGQELKMGQSLI